MDYYIDEEDYRIDVSGSVEEIVSCMTALDRVIADGSCFSQFGEDLINLEKICDVKQFNFNSYERVYYNHNSILYVPNVSYDARPYAFKIMKKHFNEALNLLQ